MKTKLILTFLFISIFVHSQDIRVNLDTLTMDDYLHYRLIPNVGITMDIIVKSGKEYIEWCWRDSVLLQGNGYSVMMYFDSEDAKIKSRQREDVYLPINKPTFEGYIKWFDELLKEER